MEPQHFPPEPSGDPLEDLRALTRLVVGGAELSAAELLYRLRQWELQVTGELSRQAAGTGQSPAEQDPPVLARLALVGLLFELQDQARRSLSLAGRVQRLAGRVLRPMFRPLFSSRLFSPARTQVDRLVARGQVELERWAARGRQEEEHSIMLARLAFDETVDFYLEYLTQNPEVQELVQQQSTGLANELLEEARERAVSADSFLEALARSLMRRMPRARLPEPPPEVRQAGAPRKLSRSRGAQPPPATPEERRAGE